MCEASVADRVSSLPSALNSTPNTMIRIPAKICGKYAMSRFTQIENAVSPRTSVAKTAKKIIVPQNTILLNSVVMVLDNSKRARFPLENSRFNTLLKRVASRMLSALSIRATNQPKIIRMMAPNSLGENSINCFHKPEKILGNSSVISLIHSWCIPIKNFLMSIRRFKIR